MRWVYLLSHIKIVMIRGYVAMIRIWRGLVDKLTLIMIYNRLLWRCEVKDRLVLSRLIVDRHIRLLKLLVLICWVGILQVTIVVVYISILYKLLLLNRLSVDLRILWQRVLWQIVMWQSLLWHIELLRSILNWLGITFTRLLYYGLIYLLFVVHLWVILV